MNDNLEEFDDSDQEATEDHMVIHKMVTAVAEDNNEAAIAAFRSATRPDNVILFMLFSLIDGDDHYMPSRKTLGAQTAVALLTAKVTDGDDFISLLTNLINDEPTNLLAAVDTLTDMTIDQIMQLAQHHGEDPEEQERTVLKTLTEWGKVAADNE
jgi:hypothetical protein